MPKLIAIATWLLCALPVLAGLSSTVQWNVRTDGNDNNGGGFDSSVGSPGTDYSRQAAAQVAFTDLVIGATNTQLTSVLNPFTSADVGNLIQIFSGSGFTTGIYTVESVAGGVAIMDRAVGTATSTGGAGNLGGAFATVAQAMAQTQNNNIINIKTGTYTQTATLVLNTDNNVFIGYGSAYADGGTRPTITTATDSTDLIEDNGVPGNNSSWDNIAFSNTASTSANGFKKTNYEGGIVILRNAKLTGFTVAINGDNAGAHGYFASIQLFNTEVASCTYGIVNELTNGLIYLGPGTYMHGCTTSAVYPTNGQIVILDGAVLDSNGYGIGGGGTSLTVIASNSVISNSTNDGIIFGSSGSYFSSVNCIYYSNGGWGINGGSGSTLVTLGAYANNAYGANTLGNYRNINNEGNPPASATVGDVALGSCNPFVSSSNFALSTCGKTTLAGKGFPGATAAGTGYIDLAPLQTNASAGSGSAHAYVQ